tara:strand:+ start:2093 stop:3004 length:912 start_codon:yes stop_codon:yes gene_type:complete
METPAKTNSGREKIRNAYESLWFKPVDECQYALIRISFSIIAFLNLCELWTYRHAFFSAEGIIPQGVAFAETQYFYLSFFGIFQSPFVVSVYFVFSALAIACLAIGWKPRIAAFFVFLWLMSFSVRAPVAAAGWDFVLRCFSFLILVSPLGNGWKIPRKGFPPKRAVLSYGLTLMRLQVVVIYLQAVIPKLRDPWWKNGEFFPYFLFSYHSTWSGPWILENLALLKLVTWSTLVVEVSLPFLLLIPRTRWIGIILGCSFHLSIIFVSPNIAMFSLTMMMTYLVFLRANDINRLRSKFSPGNPG